MKPFLLHSVNRSIPIAIAIAVATATTAILATAFQTTSHTKKCQNISLLLKRYAFPSKRNPNSPYDDVFTSISGNSKQRRIELEHQQQQNSNRFVKYSDATTALSQSWLKDAFSNLGENVKNIQKQTLATNNPKPKNLELTNNNNTSKDDSTEGRVVRTAAKSFDSKSSTPASRSYTTNKPSQAQISISNHGVNGDYNHYRTTALKGTLDRAVSILTSDVLDLLRQTGYPEVRDGDLGENIFVDGVNFSFFQIGKRYKFAPPSSDDSEKDSGDGVIVEITERMEPCGNLCKLPFINSDRLKPLERIKKCQNFLSFLDQRDGLRGWYAKIVGDGGVVQVGHAVVQLS